MKNKKHIAYLILRIGLGVVFFLFGIGKLQNDMWAQTIRNMDFFMGLPWSVNISVILIGVSEAITGIALILGIFTKFFASLAALQLIGILALLKLDQVRDIGLLAAALCLVLDSSASFGPKD